MNKACCKNATRLFPFNVGAARYPTAHVIARPNGPWRSSGTTLDTCLQLDGCYQEIATSPAAPRNDTEIHGASRRRPLQVQKLEIIAEWLLTLSR